MQMIIQKKTFLILLFLFILSVILRAPNINRTLDYHGWVTAHTLVTLHIWGESPQKYHYSPVYTFEKAGDKHTANLGGLLDPNGDYYYISYPPFSFILPYFLSRLLLTDPSPLFLQIINLCIHFISAFGIYKILMLIFKKEEGSIKSLAAITAYCIYVFSTGNLWFHGNIFFVDEIVQPFFVYSIYYILKVDRESFSGHREIFILFVLFFLTVYTEWIGVLLSITAIFFIGLSKLKLFWKRISIFAIIAALSLSLFVTIFQYSLISNLANVIADFSSKYLIRSGISYLGGEEGLSFLSVEAYKNIAYFYFRNYLGTILLLTYLLFVLFLSRKKLHFNRIKEAYPVFYLSGMPVILHYIIFFNFNVNHTFSALKSSIFFSLAVGILARECIKIYKSAQSTFIFIGGAMIFLITSIGQYYLYYYPRELHNHFVQLGSYISSNARDNEVVFLCEYPGGNIEPQLLWYSKRNIHTCIDALDASKQMKQLNMRTGFIITLDSQYQISKKLHIYE